MRRRRGGRSGVCGAVCGAVRAPGVRGTESEMPIELRPVGQLSPREFARNAAPLQYQHAIRERGDEVEVLLHQQDRQPSGFPEPGEDLRHVFDDRGLDTLGGLVEQEKHGVPHQASRQGQKLLLAAREHLARSVEERFEPGKSISSAASAAPSSLSPWSRRAKWRFSRTDSRGKIPRP